MKRRTILLISTIAILSVVGAAGYFGFSGSAQQPPTPEAPQTATVTKCDVEQSVTAPGALHNASETLVLMPVDGNLSQVSVQAGDHVSASQVLARLDDTLKAQAEIDLRDAQKEYQKAYNYRLSLNGKQWLRRVTYRYDNGQQIPITKWYRGYMDAQTIKSADEKLALRKAELDDAQAVLDQMELKAPFSGVVTEVDAVVGLPKMAGDTLFKMIDPKALEVKANVTQEDYPLLKPGQSVVVYFDARPDVTAHGKVDRIVPKLIEGSSPTYDIFITLDEVPDGLVDGMTADANVTIASREGVLCLPRSVVHASAENKAKVQVWNGSATEDREITVGLRGDANVEIVSGLAEGDQVVVK
jgi:multidrug efflux pump subunit AcrA (membrane-fusion protein)